jgi:hypothetical protein
MRIKYDDQQCALSLSIMARETHIDDHKETPISVCDKVGDIDTLNQMTSVSDIY